MRYRLRTLLILVALLPPILAVIAPPLAQRFVQEPQIVRAVSHSRPIFAQYPLRYVDVASAYQVLSTTWANRSNVRMSADPVSNSLSVLAPPEDQAQIQVILNDLEQRAPSPRTSAELDRRHAKPPEMYFLPHYRTRPKKDANEI